MDPCALTGHVGCSHVGGQLRITSIALMNSTLVGFVPPELSALQALKRLSLSGNIGLSGSVLPALPFSQYTGGCAVDGAAFDCPLPAGVEGCHAAWVPPPKSGKSGQCLDTAPISTACELEFFTVAGNQAYQAAANKVSADMGAIFKSPVVSKCVQVALSRENKTCEVPVDWEPFAADLVAASEEASAALPKGSIQYCPIGGILEAPYGPIVLHLVLDRILWFPLPDKCGRADRMNLLSSFENASSPFDNFVWGTDPCITGKAADEMMMAEKLLQPATRIVTVQSMRQQQEPPPSDVVATPLVSKWLGLRLSESSGDGQSPPPLSQQCLVDTEKLLGSQSFMEAYAALEEAVDLLVLEPLGKKCGLDLALTGACKSTADFSKVATQFAAANAAASAVTAAATVCKFDAEYYKLNKNVKAKFPLWKLTVEGGRVLWPVPASCTSADRQRLPTLLGGTPQQCEKEAQGVRCYFTFSDEACNVQPHMAANSTAADGVY